METDEKGKVEEKENVDRKDVKTEVTDAREPCATLPPQGQRMQQHDKAAFCDLLCWAYLRKFNLAFS